MAGTAPYDNDAASPCFAFVFAGMEASIATQSNF
jgi:hypothetical protein